MEGAGSGSIHAWQQTPGIAPPISTLARHLGLHQGLHVASEDPKAASEDCKVAVHKTEESAGSAFPRYDNVELGVG